MSCLSVLVKIYKCHLQLHKCAGSVISSSFLHYNNPKICHFLSINWKENVTKSSLIFLLGNQKYIFRSSITARWNNSSPLPHSPPKSLPLKTEPSWIFVHNGFFYKMQEAQDTNFIHRVITFLLIDWSLCNLVILFIWYSTNSALNLIEIVWKLIELWSKENNKKNSPLLVM